MWTITPQGPLNNMSESSKYTQDGDTFLHCCCCIPHPDFVEHEIFHQESTKDLIKIDSAMHSPHVVC